MRSKKTLSAVLSALILIAVYGYNIYAERAEVKVEVNKGAVAKAETKPFFMPTSTTGQVVHHNGYSLSYSEPHEQAEWVAYELKKNQLSKTNFKRPFFEVDKAVKTASAHWRNYKKSGYTKGHLCPAADRRYSKAAHDETFLMSNVSPQHADFNGGVWSRLEQKVRYWAKKYNGVFVVTGGVLQPHLKTIGKDKVAVPKQFYKVLLDISGKQPRMIGFLVPHKNSNKPLYEFVVPVDTIEALTGIDFFAALEDGIEQPLEASGSYKSWSF